MEQNPDGLPQLSKEVIEVFLRDISQRSQEGNKGYFKELYSGILSSNPNIEQLMDEFNNGSVIEKGVRMGIVSMYELLRRQIESDKLEKDYS